MPANTDFDYPGLNIKRGTSALVTQIQLKGSTSGLLTVKSPAVTGTNTITLPAGTTDFSATGGANQVLKQLSVGGAITVAQLAFTELSGTLAVNQGGTGVAVRGATAQSTPANPTGTTSLVGVMMGLAGSITPATTGTILVIISGVAQNNTNGDGFGVQIRYGTGSAPANAAALIGTAVGNMPAAVIDTGSNNVGFTCNVVITALSVGTPIWLDVSLKAITGGTAAIGTLSISAIEITI